MAGNDWPTSARLAEVRTGLRWVVGLLLFLGTASVTVGVLNLRRAELNAEAHRNQPRIPFTSTFVDTNGDTHEIETHRGQYDPDETEDEHVARHIREFKKLKEAVKNAGK